VLDDAVVSVDAARITKTASLTPSASSVSVPVAPTGPAAVYTPGFSVLPPISASTCAVVACEASCP
jgi:hypothetical protein